MQVYVHLYHYHTLKNNHKYTSPGCTQHSDSTGTYALVVYVRTSPICNLNAVPVQPELLLLPPPMQEFCKSFFAQFLNN
eukprot:m.4687 g.4687  ORF g.4687 m.4687 type:complete len:79 (+) comp3562_c0_seq1:378-614(+)